MVTVIILYVIIITTINVNINAIWLIRKLRLREVCRPSENSPLRFEPHALPLLYAAPRTRSQDTAQPHGRHLQGKQPLGYEWKSLEFVSIAQADSWS